MLLHLIQWLARGQEEGEETSSYFCLLLEWKALPEDENTEAR